MGVSLYPQTTALAVTKTFAPVRWRVAAPGGTVVANGQVLW